MAIKSASGINSTPHMYEGDRDADVAFDTHICRYIVQLKVHRSALKHVVHLKRCSQQIILAMNLANLIKRLNVKKGNWILLCPSTCLRVIRVLILISSHDTHLYFFVSHFHALHCNPSLSACKKESTLQSSSYEHLI